MGPAHPGHCRGCGPLSPVGRSGGGSTGRPRSCVGEGERIMNCGAATAFLPNFVGFPSLRGLLSSTVQPGRTLRPRGARRCVGAPAGCVPRRALVRGGARSQARAPWRDPGAGPVARMRFPLLELGCPVSAAASTASAAAPSPAPAGRPASAGRAATAGVARAVSARGRAAVPGPPTAPAGRPRAPAPDASGGRAAARSGREPGDQQGGEHDQDEADDHGVTLLPLSGLAPGRSPEATPRGCLAVCAQDVPGVRHVLGFSMFSTSSA